MYSAKWCLLCLVLISGSALAERKELDKISREIPAGFSDVRVPNPNRRDGYDLVAKENKVVFDADAGEYIYTYYRENGEEVTIRHEPSNRIDVTVICNVEFDNASGEYTYRYSITNKNTSKQPLRVFAIDIDPEMVLRTESFSGWVYYSTLPRSPDLPKWAFWGSSGGYVEPGQTVILTLISAEGPVVVQCHTAGRAKPTQTPDGAIDKFGVPPPNKEGATGKTIGPGKLDEASRDVALREIFEVGREWGWVNSENYAAALNQIPVNQAVGREQFEALMRDFGAPKPGIEPEVSALLNHIGQQKFGLE